jgi:hypothetical protein
MMKSRHSKKQSWTAGDCFIVPLLDGPFGLAQIVAYEAEALNSVLCCIFRNRLNAVPEVVAAPPETDLISVLFVTRDLLDLGHWQVISRWPPLDVRKYVDLSRLRRAGFVGVKIIGSGNVTEFLNAYHRLAPWNNYHKPDYLDRLLISPDRKPVDPLMK